MYAIRNVTNGRTYVGMTTDLARRMREHRRSPPSRMRADSRNCNDDWAAVFVPEVLQVLHVTYADAELAETAWIDNLGTTGKSGYNSVAGGPKYCPKLRFLLRTGTI